MKIMPWLHHLVRPQGELAVTHRARGVKMVLGPASSPITFIYRNGCNMVKIAETSKTSEHPGFFAQWLPGWG